MSLAFLMCVERGPLESQSLLCAGSLREFGGAMANAPFYAFAPRPGHGPAEETRATLLELGVEFVDEPLNADLTELPHANKVFVSAWADAELDCDVHVFCDTDTFFLAEPSELEGEWDAALRPVGAINRGSKGEGHRNDPDWQTMYAELGVKERPFVETVASRKRIRAYFNAGLVAFRREAELGRSWREATLRLLRTSIAERPPLRRQIDQLSLAGILSDRMERVHFLPDTYNYPLPKRVRLPREMQDLDLADLVHVHGHRWLHFPGLLEEVKPPLERDSAAYRWLDERLPLQPEIEGPFRFEGEEPQE